MGGGTIKVDILGLALCFHLIHQCICIRELHLRVAKHHHKAASGQSFFYQLQQDNTVLASGERHMEAVQRLLTPFIDLVNFLHGDLLDNIHKYAVFLAHKVKIDGFQNSPWRQHLCRWLAIVIFQTDNIHSGLYIKGTA